MADIGVMFKPEMVLALLSGNKTQTRRISKPRGKTGDRLWVRETWASADCFYQDHENEVPSVVCYRADKSALQFNAAKPTPPPAYDIAQWNWSIIKWRPSILMPKWAARIWREIVDVRQERLLDLTNDDAVAEGAVQLTGEPWSFEIAGERFFGSTPATAFWNAWDGFNTETPSGSNPLVTVYSFREVSGV